MNKMNKKGFTIVELVIVIAVIAILAGVLIPTFGGIITRANESAAMQAVSNAYKEAYAIALANDGKVTAADFTTLTRDTTDAADAKCIAVGNFDFTWTADGGWKAVGYDKSAGYTYTYANDAWTAKEVSNN